MRNKICCLIALLISLNATSQTVITDVTIVDVEHSRLITHQSVLIDGNIIKMIEPSPKFKIPSNARRIAGTNKFLMPGLIDAHAHPYDGDLYSDDGIDLTKYKSYQQAITESKARLATNYKRFLQCGITTVIAPGSTIGILKVKDSLSRKSPITTVYMAGRMITVSDFGNSHNLSPEDEYFDFAPNVEVAKTIIQNQLAFHPSFIKIFFIPDPTGKNIEDSAKAKYPIVKTIIDEAHKNNIKVAVHATERITAQLAVEAGCDYLVHEVHNEIVGDDFIQLLKQKKIILCPTTNVEYPILRTFTQNTGYSSYELSHADPYVIKTFFDLQDIDTALFRQYKLRWKSNRKPFRRDSIRLVNLKKMADANILIAAGTDAGGLGSVPAASYLPELLKMKQSGMTNWQILKAATLTPTFFINKEDSLGTITTGKIADMVLLNRNPVNNLENLNDIALVFKNGKTVSPDTLISETADMLVQRQWNAYNAKNMDAFLACFDKNVKVYNFPAFLLYTGTDDLKKNYAIQLRSASKTHCEIKGRIISGDTVIDKIAIKETGKKDVEATLIFKIRNHKVNSIYLIK